MRLRRSTWTARLLTGIPHALTLVRVVLGVAFPWIRGHWRIAAVVVAALSDFLDGVASRKLRVASSTGRMFDPIADKVFVFGVIGTLLFEGTLTWWEMLLLGLRDLAVFCGVGWLMVQRNWAALRRLPPSLLGKATTVAQFAYILLLLQWPERHVAVLTGTVGLSALAAVQYTWLFLERLRRSRRVATRRPASPVKAA